MTLVEERWDGHHRFRGRRSISCVSCVDLEDRERERESHFFEINSRLWTTKPPIDRLLRGLRARSSASWGISGYSESGKDDWDAWMVFDLLAEVVCAAKF